MSLHLNKNFVPSRLNIRHWFCVAVILLLFCSSSLESETKCETCRELVKHFTEVVNVALDFE